MSLKEDYKQHEVENVNHTLLENSPNKVNTKKAACSVPYFTYALIFIQIAFFLWMEVHGGSTNTSTLIKYGAKYNPLIYKGEWWRFITPVFLHIGFIHLATNTLALFYLGVSVEKIYGHVRFLLIYLFAGVTSFIASFLVSSTLSAGASGAIFGCLGALLYFITIYPKLFFRTMGLNIIFVLVVNLVFGFTATGIDNAGHLGGLVGGFLAAGVVYFPKKKKPLAQFLMFGVTTILVWASLTYGFSPSVKAKDESSNLILAQDYIKNENYDKANSILKNVVEKSENPSAQVYFLLSFSEIKKGMLPDARKHLHQAIHLEPDFHEANFNLALIYMEENDFRKAKKYAEKASKLKPKHKEYSNLVREINGYIQSSGGGE